MSDERKNSSVLRRAALVAVLLTAHHATLATAQEIPPFGQPDADFYGAAGSGVRVAWKLDRTEVPEDGEIVATLLITNATNPAKITRPDLKALKPFSDLFVITDNPDPPADGAREIAFSYRLRPRNRQTDRLPTFNFYYFNPAAPAGKQFKLTNTGVAIPIIVTAPPPKPQPAPTPMAEPDYLFAVTTGPELLDRPAVTVGTWTWVVVGLAGPVVALGWYAAWRQVFPDGHRLARIRRSRAARRAAAAIRRAVRTPDPPATVAVAVLGYLRERYPLPPGAVTPVEVGSALVELGLAAADCDAVTGFLRECDAARFAAVSDDGLPLAADAAALLARLEAA